MCTPFCWDSLYLRKDLQTGGIASFYAVLLFLPCALDNASCTISQFPQSQSSASESAVTFWTAEPHQLLFRNLPILWIFKLHHILFTTPKQMQSLFPGRSDHDPKWFQWFFSVQRVGLFSIPVMKYMLLSKSPKLIFIPVHLVNQRNLKFFTYQKLYDNVET